jgi:hypothetical protein
MRSSAMSTAWFVMTLAAVVTAVWSWRFMLNGDLITLEGWQDHLHRHPVATYLHFGIAPLALLVGGFQFLPSWRINRPGLHRALGYAYVLSTWLGGLSALPLALESREGVLASMGFGFLGIGWLFTTTLAFISVRSGNYGEHHRWMIRSFALCFAAVTLRLYVAVFSGLLGWDIVTVYRAASWMCWVGNLAVAEWLIQRRPALRRS